MRQIKHFRECIGRHARIFLPAVITVFAVISCNKAGDDLVTDLEKPSASTVLTLANAPVLDGSDSTNPLRRLLLCSQLGIGYGWVQHLATDGTWGIEPRWENMTEKEKERFREIDRQNNTHGSFVNLIDGKVDLILTARGVSRDERRYADEKGVMLTERPIARDAFVFIVNPNNEVRNLTIEQIQRIYTGEITNWREVGGQDAQIHPYVRNPNSGSQEKMETLVMKGLTMGSWPELLITTMLSPYISVGNDVDGIAYTPYYYYNTIVNDERTALIAVNGIMPGRKAIENGAYPYVTEVMAAVRADIDKSSTAYQLFYRLCAGQLNDIISESKYVLRE